eukprot:3940356-Rhodomonas_salina.1
MTATAHPLVAAYARSYYTGHRSKWQMRVAAFAVSVQHMAQQHTVAQYQTWHSSICCVTTGYGVAAYSRGIAYAVSPLCSSHSSAPVAPYARSVQHIA